MHRAEIDQLLRAAGITTDGRATDEVFSPPAPPAPVPGPGPNGE
jgi:hypothetical protein